MTESYWIDESLKRKTVQDFIDKAKKLYPVLIHKYKKPVSYTEQRAKDEWLPTKEYLSGTTWIELKKDDCVIYDFGHHTVGYITLDFDSKGSPQDAPAFLHIKFGERKKELFEDSANHEGWLSKSWIQEEWYHIDELPLLLNMQRRYAFQYLMIEVIDVSKKYRLVVKDVRCDAVSAVDTKLIQPLKTKDELLRKIDEVSIRTLANCMQTFFEDGPKRDRRLWLGDLYLQALTDYSTFKDYGMVKRCLYLFAGLTAENGMMGANVFAEPKFVVDDTFFFDYSLLFVYTLADYAQITGDLETVQELWPSAYRQIELARDKFNDQKLFIEDSQPCFIDWKDGLSKQASAQAIFIEALIRAAEIVDLLKTQGRVLIAESAEMLRREADLYKESAMQYLWSDTDQLFYSGSQKQISYASQVWMILAGVVKGESASRLIRHCIEVNPDMNMVTPYMNHYFVEALIKWGEKELAMEHIKKYWGGMIEKSADTFWELYNPDDPEETPYGSSMVNSYCHAWSCTPTYFLRGALDDMI